MTKQNREVQLTVAVPAYNSEAYLEKCLDSLVDADTRLEVIVVNDGSTDQTETIANRYVNTYPEQVRLINKKNGGHGSAINCAVERAAGRYFKVIDADDWIFRENLTALLDALEHTKADAVITGYQTLHVGNGKILTYSTECQYVGQEVDLPQLLEVYDQISSCCSFHGLLYRTQFYRSCGFRLSEGIFYEDHEYAILPFSHVETILILPFLFYEYRIGNNGQSVAFHNQVKRIHHIETVIRKILDYRDACNPLRPDREEYILRKLCVVVVSYFAVALVKDCDRKAGEKKAQQFREWIESRDPQLLKRISKKYHTILWFHRLHLPASLYQSILDTNLYKRFRRIWMS